MKRQIAFALALLPELSAATTTPSLCDAAAQLASREHGIPLQIMLAITRVETGRAINGILSPWPWAVNGAGQSHWFETQSDAALHVESEIEAGKTNIDIGCFQLNLRWHGAAFSSVQHMFDPEENAQYAARFLLENHARTGNWVDAVAAYHSKNPEKAEPYIEKIEAVLAALQKDPAPNSAALEQADHGEESRNSFPLLQKGKSRGTASLVPQHDGLAPLLIAAP